MSFRIVPAGGLAMGLIVTIGLAPGVIVIAALEPAPLPWWVLALAVLVPLGMLVLFLLIAHAARRGRVDVGDDGLRLHGSIYGRAVPASQLRTGRARLVDLTMDRDLQTTLKTNGIALPGYAEGWFRLRNGNKALLLVTEKRRVVYIPTAAGYDLLVSPEDGKGLLGELQRRWPRESDDRGNE